MTIRLNKKWERERTIWEIAEVLRQEMAQYPEIIEYQAALSSGGPGGGNTVDVEIYGYDFDITNQMAQQIIALTKELPGARDVYADRDDDRPEIKIIGESFAPWFDIGYYFYILAQPCEWYGSRLPQGGW